MPTHQKLINLGFLLSDTQYQALSQDVDRQPLLEFLGGIPKLSAVKLINTITLPRLLTILEVEKVDLVLAKLKKLVTFIESPAVICLRDRSFRDRIRHIFSAKIFSAAYFHKMLEGHAAAAATNPIITSALPISRVSAAGGGGGYATSGRRTGEKIDKVYDIIASLLGIDAFLENGATAQMNQQAGIKPAPQQLSKRITDKKRKIEEIEHSLAENRMLNQQEKESYKKKKTKLTEDLAYAENPLNIVRMILAEKKGTLAGEKLDPSKYNAPLKRIFFELKKDENALRNMLENPLPPEVRADRIRLAMEALFIAEKIGEEEDDGLGFQSGLNRLIEDGHPMLNPETMQIKSEQLELDENDEQNELGWALGEMNEDIEVIESTLGLLFLYSWPNLQGSQLAMHHPDISKNTKMSNLLCELLANAESLRSAFYCCFNYGTMPNLSAAYANLLSMRANFDELDNKNMEVMDQRRSWLQQSSNSNSSSSAQVEVGNLPNGRRGKVLRFPTENNDRVQPLGFSPDVRSSLSSGSSAVSSVRVTNTQGTQVQQSQLNTQRQLDNEKNDCSSGRTKSPK